ncbi:MAG: hypothetical protein ACYDCK_01795 [Thermoplasmatota archaeon]
MLRAACLIFLALAAGCVAGDSALPVAFDAQAVVASRFVAAGFQFEPSYHGANATLFTYALGESDRDNSVTPTSEFRLFRERADSYRIEGSIRETSSDAICPPPGNGCSAREGVLVVTPLVDLADGAYRVVLRCTVVPQPFGSEQACATDATTTFRIANGTLAS